MTSLYVLVVSSSFFLFFFVVMELPDELGAQRAGIPIQMLYGISTDVPLCNSSHPICPVLKQDFFP
jgi:hypothetical protein